MDECQLYVAPIIVGGGKPAFPKGTQLKLSLVMERRFGNGMVYLKYSVDPADNR